MSTIGPDISRSLPALRYCDSVILFTFVVIVRKEPKKGSQRLYRIKRINTEWEVGNVRVDNNGNKNNSNKK